MKNEINETVESIECDKEIHQSDISETFEDKDTYEVENISKIHSDNTITFPEVIEQPLKTKSKKRIGKKAIITLSSIVAGLILLSIASIILFNVVSNHKQIKAVEASINNIGQIELTNECKERIDNAITNYNALSEKQKKKISNTSLLTNASTSYNLLSYYDNLVSACSFVNKKATAALEILNDMKTVWSNTIYRKTDEYNNGNYDFDTAMNAYWDSYNYSKNSLLLYDNINQDDRQKKITDYLSELKDPPDKYKNAYDAFAALYANYSAMVPLTKSVNHTYSSFSTEVNTMSTNYKTQYGKVKAIVPETK